MKAELKSNGTLVVTAEAEIEIYALKQWASANIAVGQEINLVVDFKPMGKE